MRDARAGVGAGCTEADDAKSALRARVLKSAFKLFRDQGYANTSMLQIATAAQASKRDLYSLYDNKLMLLADCIGQRSRGMRRLLDAQLPMPTSKRALEAMLVSIGTSIMQTVCSADVLMTFRLAIAEADRAPEIARVLYQNGPEANQLALAAFFRKAQAQGLIEHSEPAALARRYASVLWADLMIPLLLRVREAPSSKEIESRAKAATEAVLGR